MKLWQRYLLWHLVPTFAFLLVGIFLMYVIVDLSIHGIGLFASQNVSYWEGALYYLSQFLVFLDFFFPLSFLLASLKVLLDLNSNHELVALQMAGLSKKKILAPLFVFGTLLSIFSYISTECIAPAAHEIVDDFWNAHAKNKKKLQSEHLHTLALEDNSELIYQRYDASKEELYDIFWIRSKGDIWRFRTLDAQTQMARDAEHFLRSELWQKVESYPQKIMNELKLGTIQRFIPFENRSIYSLFQQLKTRLPDRPIAQAHFFYKISRPLLTLVVLFSIAPLALRFGRGRSHYMLLAFSLATFFGFMTILDGMLLIGETHLLPAGLAILSPFALLIGSSFRAFIRM